MTISSVDKDLGEMILINCEWKCKIVYLLWREKKMAYFLKLKIGLFDNPEVLLLRIHLGETPVNMYKETCAKMLTEHFCWWWLAKHWKDCKCL